MGDMLTTGRPGCFGAATVFSHDSEVCRVCEAFQGCSEASIETLKTIRGVINVEDILKRHEKAKRSSRAVIARSDTDAAETATPGNVKPPMLKVAERKTEIAKVKVGMTSEEEAIMMTLTSKTREFALLIGEKGLIEPAKKGLRSGRNIIKEAGTRKWVGVLIDALLAGGFSWVEARDMLMAKLEWKDSTASSYTTMTIQFLTAFNIARETEGRYVLHPAVAPENTRNEIKAKESA